MKTINRDKIQRMIGNVGGNGGNGSSSADLAGYATQMWVEQNYISKAFFNTLFTVHGHDADDTANPPTDVIIEPNDTETVLDSIEAMVGLWTEKYLSALGLSSGGGGGGDVLAEPLVSINGIGSPTAANQTLVWDGTRWAFKPYGQGGGGSVTSIRITVPAGFNVSPSTAITTAGTFAITFATGYSLPTTAKQNNWDSAYTWVNANGASTVEKTAWGKKYWLAGAPASIDGDMTSVGNISFSASGKNIGGVAYFDTTNSRLGIGAAPGAYKLDVNGTVHLSDNLYINSTKKIVCMVNNTSKTLLDFDGSQVTLGYGFNGSNATHIYGQNINMYYGTSLKVQVTTDGLKIGGATLSWDSNAGALKIDTGFYSETFISALGANSESGGGVGDVTWSALASSSDTRQIAASHLSSVTQPLYFLFNDEVNPTVTYNGKTNQAVGNILTKKYADGRYVKQSGNAIISGTATIGGNMTIGATEAVGTVNSQVIQTLNSRAIYIKTGTAPNFVDGTWSSTSDIRLKDIINNVGASVDQIANAPIFNYKWKSGGVSIMLGSSAQYWQNVFQHAVEIGPENYLYMDYSSVALASAVMVARKVVNHEERIKQLEKEIELLKAMQS